jgi:hypothetical protein
MITEQALLHLPEILTGSGYPEQHYESGIVSAFSLALLQALNGRNVPNPISCLQTEKPFRGREGWPRPAPEMPRYLRADLNVKLNRMKAGSKRLAAYGWRHDNWIESKFFRGAVPNKQVNTGALLADLLRILTLVPSIRDRKNQDNEITGRFLLHVYEGLDPLPYHQMNKQLNPGSEPRKWLAPLLTSGRNKCEPIQLSEYEAGGILGQINANLGELRIEFDATTFRIDPIVDLGQNFTQYTCILSRIDAFKVTRGEVSLEVRADRTVIETPNKDQVTAVIREHVGRWINMKAGGVEEKLPDEEEVEDDEVDADQAASAQAVPAQA